MHDSGDLATAIEALRTHTGRFPRQALAYAIAHPDEMAPRLLEFLSYARDNAETIISEKSDFMGHLYAAHLLAQFRDTRAYPLLIDIGSLPDETAHDLTGSFITEGFCRALASVCPGDTAPAERLVASPHTDEYVRGACLRSIVALYALGQRTREQTVGYLRGLFRGGLERSYSHIWNALVSAAIDIHPGELAAEIGKAYDDGLVDNGFVTRDEVVEEIRRPIERTLKDMRQRKRYTLITDTMAEMEWWACFEDRVRTPAQAWLAGDTTPSPPKIGRNDPCPCGSGKKYKKCCMKQ